MNVAFIASMLLLTVALNSSQLRQWQNRKHMEGERQPLEVATEQRVLKINKRKT
jgi:hypothetical protein